LKGKNKRKKGIIHIYRTYQCTPDGIVAGAIGGAAGWFSFEVLDGDAADIVFCKIKMQENKKKN
jgi:hypothetical protein